jgi:hypothetical protein
MHTNTSKPMGPCISASQQRGAYGDNYFELHNGCGLPVTVTFCATGYFQVASGYPQQNIFPCTSGYQGTGAIDIEPNANVQILNAQTEAGSQYRLEAHWIACSKPGWIHDIHWSGELYGSCSDTP